jgi:hypothetical protein
MWPAVLGSTITSTFISWALLSSHFGWLDEIFYKNMAITISASLVISILIGAVASAMRNKKNEKI